jgi:hypothetical protein
MPNSLTILRVDSRVLESFPSGIVDPNPQEIPYLVPNPQASPQASHVNFQPSYPVSVFSTASFPFTTSRQLLLSPQY